MPLNPTRIKAKDQLDNHTVELRLRSERAATIFYYLDTYNPGPGAMPIVEWNTPTTGSPFLYKSTNGELYFEGLPYNSLTTEQAREFWQWVDKFVVVCMKAYDKEYGL